MTAGRLVHGLRELRMIERHFFYRTVRIKEHVLRSALDTVRIPEVVGVTDPVRGARLIEHQVASLSLQIMRTLIVGECPLRIYRWNRKGEQQDQREAVTVRHL